jgi:nucleoside transporter
MELMRKQIKIRLTLMMFFEYFIWGTWYVTLSTWLGQSLHFSGRQIGLVSGTTAIGAIVSPFFIGLVADRLFATQKVLAALHGLGASFLLLASSRSSFGPLYFLLLLYAVCYMPTLALTNSLAFRLMRDPKLEFGPIRVLGTVGWIVAGLLIGNLRLEATAMPLRIAALASLIMAVYCLTLPDTPPLAGSTERSLRGVFPVKAARLFLERSFAIFTLTSFLICIPLQFYYAFTNLFLNEIGVKNAVGKMTGGQMSELFCMLLIPWFFRRLGVKYMLVAGMLAWTIRYVLFAFGNNGQDMRMLWLGILLHGICYDFFFVTGQIYVDRKAPLALRAAAQGLITLITYGAGMLLGSWLSGSVVDRYAYVSPSGAMMHNWQSIWSIAAVWSASALILFIPTFSDNERIAGSRISKRLNREYNQILRR